LVPAVGEDSIWRDLCLSITSSWPERKKADLGKCQFAFLARIVDVVVLEIFFRTGDIGAGESCCGAEIFICVFYEPADDASGAIDEGVDVGEHHYLCTVFEAEGVGCL